MTLLLTFAEAVAGGERTMSTAGRSGSVPILDGT
jgi:hypothetical protein